MSTSGFDSDLILAVFIVTYIGMALGGERLYAPLLFKGYNGWDSGLLVQNLADRPLAVTATYGSTEGQWRESVTLPPRAAVSLYPSLNADLPETWVGAAALEASPGWG